MKEKYWKYSLIAIILLMGVIIFRQITPFMGGLLGALTIYILVRGQMEYLTGKRHLKRYVAALLIIAETVLLFLVPAGLTVWLLIDLLQHINLDPQTFIRPIQQAAEAIKNKTGYDVLGNDTLSYLISLTPRVGQLIMGSISSLAVNLFVMIFILYFMLLGGKKMEAYVDDLLPFNDKNTQEVTNEIAMTVRSNAIGIPLLAIIQGAVAMIGSHLRCSQCMDFRVLHLLCHDYPDGRHGVGMVSGMCLFRTDGQLVRCHRPVCIRCHCHLTIRQPDTVYPPEENGRHPSAHHHLRCCYRTADFRIYGHNLRPVVAFSLLSLCGYV